MSSIVVSAAVCTGPSPRYAGVERPPEADPDAALPIPDASAADRAPSADAAVDSPPLPDATADVTPADGLASNPDLAADAGAGPDTAIAADPPTSGLVAHWPLDEGQGTAAGDLSGNQNDGALINDPMWITSAAPTTRANPMALRLDGSNDYVDFRVRSLPRGEARKTIGVWFRNGAQTPRLRNLVALFSEAQDTGIHLGFDGARVAVWRFGDLDPIVVSTASPDSSWHHLAYSWDGTTHLLYLDGAMVGSSTAAVQTGPVQTARLGTWDPPMEIFGGDIDEVRIYDRALSPTEIAALAARN